MATRPGCISERKEGKGSIKTLWNEWNRASKNEKEFPSICGSYNLYGRETVLPGIREPLREHEKIQNNPSSLLIQSFSWDNPRWMVCSNKCYWNIVFNCLVLVFDIILPPVVYSTRYLRKYRREEEAKKDSRSQIRIKMFHNLIVI